MREAHYSTIMSHIFVFFDDFFRKSSILKEVDSESILANRIDGGCSDAKLPISRVLRTVNQGTANYVS